MPGAAAPKVEGAAKAPPPFPVMAPPKTGATLPPLPVAGATVAPVPGAGKPPVGVKLPFWKKKSFQISAAAALLVLGAGGYFALTAFLTPPPPPPPVVKAKSAVPPKAATPTTAQAALANKVAEAPPAGTAQAAAPLTPSETLNNLAHAPVNAINKAQKVADARRGSDAVDGVNALAAGETPAEKGAQKSAAPMVKSTTKTTIAPGVTGTTTDLEVASEASPAFRSFVAMAKITGVFQGTPPRVMLNGRLSRAGDIVDNALGVQFDSYDADKKLLLFKDKSGAVVPRRYP